MSGLYPARAHAAKVAREIAKKVSDEGSGKQHAILVQSAPVMFRHDTDRELPYHQEANFFYLTGCPVATSSLLVTFEILAGEPVNIKHRLYIPALDKDLAMWSVAPPSLEEARSSFDSDEIAYCEELPKALSGFVVHILPNTTEFPQFSEEIGGLLNGLDSTEKYLYEALHIARITKDEYEIDLIREANRISSSAHEVLMRELGSHASGRSKASGGARKRNVKVDVGQWEVESERDAEALFVATCRRAGAEQAYLPIVASGTNASVLHYVCNDRLFPSTSTVRKPGDTSFIPKAPHRGCCGSIPDHDHNAATTSFHDSAFEPQVLLIDAGCEWRDYASDITRTIPVGNGGKFTPRAGEIYELVLKMQKECEAMVRPGIHWDLLHLHAHKVLIEGFISFGIFTGSPEEMLHSGLTHAFFPHGLGHSLGLDVHDSRQYLKADITDTPDEVRAVPAKLHSLLRIRKKLEVGMVLTIEPGCYFPPLLMEDNGVWTSDLVNQDMLREYISVGGVRIEDVVVVREDGVENLTTVGRERAWIEKVCSGQ